MFPSDGWISLGPCRKSYTQSTMSYMSGSLCEWSVIIAQHLCWRISNACWVSCLSLPNWFGNSKPDFLAIEGLYLIPSSPEPGGYLQWVEYDHNSGFVDSPNPETKRTASETLLRSVSAGYEWAPSYPFEHTPDTPLWTCSQYWSPWADIASWNHQLGTSPAPIFWECAVHIRDPFDPLLPARAPYAIHPM